MRFLRKLLLFALFSLASVRPGGAQGAPPDSVLPEADIQAELNRARELLKNAEFDQAIDSLEKLISESNQRLQHLDEAYLLLVKAYVTQANQMKSSGQRLSAANSVMKTARDYVKECLTIPYLRHTRPLKDSPEYPQEMVDLFDEVRNELFGSFRVTRVIPPHATVRFDGEPIPENNEGTYELADIPAGTHRIFVHAPGYRDKYETMTIAANTTPEKEYRLQKNRGVLWYGPRAVILSAVGYGLTRIGGGEAKAPEPLPGPPDPPN